MFYVGSWLFLLFLLLLLFVVVARQSHHEAFLRKLKKNHKQLLDVIFCCLDLTGCNSPLSFSFQDFQDSFGVLRGSKYSKQETSFTGPSIYTLPFVCGILDLFVSNSNGTWRLLALQVERTQMERAAAVEASRAPRASRASRASQPQAGDSGCGDLQVDL